jgi:ABC-type multidrug transport system fused ATPase/permease subunit
MASCAVSNDSRAPQPEEVQDDRVDSWKEWLPVGLLLLALIPLFLVYFMRVHEMPTGLMNVLPFCSAHFAEDGFAYHRFTPPFHDLWSDYNPTGYTVWYTHYPPLPFYLGGIVWGLGGTTKAALSLFFNAVALAYVLLFYRVFSLLLNRWIACISALVLASHPLFIEQVLENYLNLSLFFQSAAFLFLVLALESTAKRIRYLLYLFAWACLFGDAFSSFDQILASSFFVFAYTLWRLGMPEWRRVTRIVGAMATASISASLCQRPAGQEPAGNTVSRKDQSAGIPFLAGRTSLVSLLHDNWGRCRDHRVSVLGVRIIERKILHPKIHGRHRDNACSQPRLLGDILATQLPSV